MKLSKRDKLEILMEGVQRETDYQDIRAFFLDEHEKVWILKFLYHLTGENRLLGTIFIYWLSDAATFATCKVYLGAVEQLPIMIIPLVVYLKQRQIQMLKSA